MLSFSQGDILLVMKNLECKPSDLILCLGMRFF